MRRQSALRLKCGPRQNRSGGRTEPNGAGRTSGVGPGSGCGGVYVFRLASDWLKVGCFRPLLLAVAFPYSSQRYARADVTGPSPWFADALRCGTLRCYFATPNVLQASEMRRRERPRSSIAPGRKEGAPRGGPGRSVGVVRGDGFAAASDYSGAARSPARLSRAASGSSRPEDDGSDQAAERTSG